MGAVGGLQSKASSSRGRPYALMLLIAFGAALLGVMLLHKFRERRICNLLLKRTDQDLRSFQLLFQRERDRSKELEKNYEDMKASLYSLRTQKMELERRLLELQSTIDSLRDEQKIVNVALREKQSEIKMLREREIETGNENSPVVALTQSLKQKEDELEDLRRRLESRGAVAADDPSDPREDSTVAVEQNKKLLEPSGGKGEENNESVEKNIEESKSTDISEGSTSKRDETENQRSEETPERREIEGEERQKQESLKDEGEKQEVVGDDVRKDDGEESKITSDHKEEGKDSEAVVNQRADKVLKSGTKMETETGKYGHTRKIRGKRWRYIARKRTVDNGWRLISKKKKQENNRNLDDSGVISTNNRKFIMGGALNEEKRKEEYPEEAREKENKMLKQELDSKNGDTSSEENDNQTGNGDGGDGSIKQNPGEEMELKDSKSEEKQEPEREEDGGFNRESNSDVVEDVKELGNKEETEESEF